MKKIVSPTQYSEELENFKKSRPACITNKLIPYSKFSSDICAGKVWMELCGDTLWFLFDEDDYYAAQFYVPVNQQIHITPKNKVLTVDLTGNPMRYDVQSEEKLIAAGFEKHQRYVELSCPLEDSIDKITSLLEPIASLGKTQGLICRSATREDYPAIRKLWVEKIGKDKFIIPNLTGTELDEMERFRRCTVVTNKQGDLLAARYYRKRKNFAYGHILASSRAGLGSWVYLEALLQAYKEGCTVSISWAPENNHRSLNFLKKTAGLTGKYFWQFLYR